MFLIAFLILAFSVILVKFGFLSATAGILAALVKVLLVLLLVAVAFGAWLWFRKRA